jgi:phosphoribosylamine--glycine ligase
LARQFLFLIGADSKKPKPLPTNAMERALRRAALTSVPAPRAPARRAAAAARAPLRVAAARGGETVLVVGGGGREHALAWRLAQSPDCGALFVAPGNAGTAMEPNMTTVPSLDPANIAAVLAFCREKRVSFVVVGPEQPLVAGLVDALAAAGVTAFGPTAAAARLEGSKAFMKALLRDAGVPTAAYGTFSDPAEAKAFIRAHGAPIVVKTSGLAAGKGVTVAATLDEALAAVDAMLVDRVYGDAGASIVVEEYLAGEEASFFALVDGETVIPLAGAQDHKAVGEGDAGPNTGGMGAYSPAPVLTPEVQAQVMREIVHPTARGMAAAGCPFRGVIFAGLMIENGRAKCLEHNVRFGDPECQVGVEY